MTRIKQINKEELEPVVTSRSKALEAAGVAEKALKDARLAELEFKVQLQQLYLAKGLDTNCRVDISNGNITWPDEIQETTAAPDADAPAAAPAAPETVTKPVVTSKKRAKKGA